MVTYTITLTIHLKIFFWTLGINMVLVLVWCKHCEHTLIKGSMVSLSVRFLVIRDSSAERNEWRIDLLTQYFGNHSELLHLGTLGNVTYLGSKISLSSNGTNVVIVRSYSDGIESKGITTTIPLADREPNFTGPVFKERTISVVQSEDGTHEIYTIMTTDGYERRKMTYSVPVDGGGAITNIRESTEKMDSNSSLNWLSGSRQVFTD